MTSLMMMSDDVGSIRTKEEALADLKRQYNSPGEPLFMCGINGIAIPTPAPYRRAPCQGSPTTQAAKSESRGSRSPTDSPRSSKPAENHPRS